MAYSQEIGDKICQRIAEGESLRAICQEQEFPSREMIYRWLREGVKDDAPPELKAFCDQYARAREDQAETYAEQVIEIADNASDDIGEGARPVIRQHVINRARLMIDTRKWAAGKLYPKKYGERVHQEHSGSVEIMEEGERLRRIEALLKEAGLAPQGDGA